MEMVVVEEMAALGIAAFDPVGVAAMPVLLAQPRGVVRAWTFLAGSAVSLMLLGIAFATGLGGPILRFNRAHPWLDHVVELVAGIVLVCVAVWLLVRSRSDKSGDLTSGSFSDRLRLPLPLLFGFGFLLVAVQSLVDVVFLLAMVEMGTRGLHAWDVVTAVGTYTLAALAIQVAVVVAYQVVPRNRRQSAMDQFNAVLERRGEFIAGILSMVLGVVLLGIATVGLTQRRHQEAAPGATGGPARAVVLDRATVGDRALLRRDSPARRPYDQAQTRRGGPWK